MHCNLRLPRTQPGDGRRPLGVISKDSQRSIPTARGGFGCRIVPARKFDSRSACSRPKPSPAQPKPSLNGRWAGRAAPSSWMMTRGASWLGLADQPKPNSQPTSFARTPFLSCGMSQLLNLILGGAWGSLAGWTITPQLVGRSALFWDSPSALGHELWYNGVTNPSELPSANCVRGGGFWGR